MNLLVPLDLTRGPSFWRIFATSRENLCHAEEFLNQVSSLWSDWATSSASLVQPRLDFGGSKKGVAQGDEIDVPHPGVVADVRVDEEEDGHVHRLSRIQFLLVKAKTLDLGEVRGGNVRGDVVGGDADNVLVAEVGGGVKGEGSLPREDGHLALLRREFPL